MVRPAFTEEIDSEQTETKGWEEGFRFTEMTGGGGGRRVAEPELQKYRREPWERSRGPRNGGICSERRLPCEAGSTLQEGDGWDRARAAR